MDSLSAVAANCRAGPNCRRSIPLDVRQSRFDSNGTVPSPEGWIRFPPSPRTAALDRIAAVLYHYPSGRAVLILTEPFLHQKDGFAFRRRRELPRWTELPGPNDRIAHHNYGPRPPFPQRNPIILKQRL